MNLNHLKYFVDAAELKSCSEAARMNRVSQPALSQSIRSLEDEMGYKILKHRPKTFELTDNGLQLLEYAKKILDLVEKARREIGSESKQLRPIRIICTHSFFKYYLKPIMKELKKKCPAWEVSILFGDRERIKQSLMAAEADIGFLISTEKLASFEVKKIGRGHFYEILSTNNTTSEAPVYVTSLKDKEVKKMLPVSTGKGVVEIGSWESIYDLVSSQLGSGIVPDYIIQDSLIPKKKLLAYDLLMLEKKSKKNDFEEFSSVLFQKIRKT